MTAHFRDLPCKLTDEEVDGARDTLAQSALELDDLKVSQKAANAQFREQRTEIEETILNAACAIRDGEAIRSVECIEQPVMEDNEVRLIRTDTDEIVTTREMEPSERQETLDSQMAPAA